MTEAAIGPAPAGAWGLLARKVELGFAVASRPKPARAPSTASLLHLSLAREPSAPPSVGPLRINDPQKKLSHRHHPQLGLVEPPGPEPARRNLKTPWPTSAHSSRPARPDWVCWYCGAGGGGHVLAAQQLLTRRRAPPSAARLYRARRNSRRRRTRVRRVVGRRGRPHIIVACAPCASTVRFVSQLVDPLTAQPRRVQPPGAPPAPSTGPTDFGAPGGQRFCAHGRPCQMFLRL